MPNSSIKKLVNHNYSRRTEPTEGFKSFEEFYPFYLGEHCNKINRRLHLIGTTISFLFLLIASKKKHPKLIGYGLVQAYVWAWFGHFVFEKNKPATFRYPIWSFYGDLRMWYEVVSLKRAF